MNVDLGSDLSLLWEGGRILEKTGMERVLIIILSFDAYSPVAVYDSSCIALTPLWLQCTVHAEALTPTIKNSCLSLIYLQYTFPHLYMLLSFISRSLFFLPKKKKQK